MGRQMPALQIKFASAVDEALTLVANTEVLWLTAPPASEIRRKLKVPQLEALYEAVFLRVFGRWESFLESLVIRWMAGYATTGYRPLAAQGQTLYRSLGDATASLHNEYGQQRDYLLWHNPVNVRKRVAAHLNGCPVEVLCTTKQADLETLAAVRHHIAHGSADSLTKFRAAAVALTGSDHTGSAGRMLRAADLADPLNQPKWIRSLTDEMKAFATLVGS